MVSCSSATCSKQPVALRITHSQVWRPDADDQAEEDMMDYDHTAYDCLHRFALEWPCLR